MSKCDNTFNEHQRRWIDELKSGKYRKSRGHLMELNVNDKPKTFCCLGVYRHAVKKQKYRKHLLGTYAEFLLGNNANASLLDTKSVKELKLYDTSGSFMRNSDLESIYFKYRSITSCVGLNDETELSLKKIGEWIENHPWYVFKNFSIPKPEKKVYS